MEMCAIEELLTNASGFDFYGICELTADARKLRWVWTHGSSSNRTLNMVQKKGTGLAGAAIRSGRLIVCDVLKGQQKLRTETGDFYDDDPVILAERLRSTAAVTIIRDQRVSGVLLAGYRTERSWDAADKEAVRRLAACIAGSRNWDWDQQRGRDAGD